MLLQENLTPYQKLFNIIDQSQREGKNTQINVNFKDEHDHDLLDYAIMERDINKVNSLLQRNVTVSKNHFHLALQHGNKDIILRLFDELTDLKQWWQNYNIKTEQAKRDNEQHYLKTEDGFGGSKFFADILANLASYSPETIETLKGLNIIQDYAFMRDFLVKATAISKYDIERFEGAIIEDNEPDALMLYFACALNDQAFLDENLSKIENTNAIYRVYKEEGGFVNISLLNAAVQKNNMPFIRSLLAQNKEDHFKDNLFQNVLFTAVILENAPVITLLLAQLKNPLSTNKDGKTVLHIAAQVGNPEVLKALMADPRLRELVNAKDYYGFTPYDYAKNNDKQTEFEKITNDYGIMPSSSSREMIEIDQEYLIPIIIYYLKMKGQFSDYINRYGLCNGLAFLKIVYDELKYKDDFKQFLELLSKHGVDANPLGSKDMVKDLQSGNYINVDDFIEHSLNSTLVFFSSFPYSANVPVIALTQYQRKEQLDLITKKDVVTEHLFELNTTLQSSEQLAEHLALISKIPGAKFELRSSGHATSGYCTAKDELDFYDPSQLYYCPPTKDIQSIASRIQKSVFAFNPHNMSMQLLVYQPSHGYESKWDFSKITDSKMYSDYIESSPNRYSPLHVAVLMRDYNAIMTFLNDPHFNTNLKDAHGLTPLNLAIRLCDPKMVDLFLNVPTIKVGKAEMKAAMQEYYLSENNFQHRHSTLMDGRTFHEKQNTNNSSEKTTEILNKIKDKYTRGGSIHAMEFKSLESLLNISSMGSLYYDPNEALIKSQMLTLQQLHESDKKSQLRQRIK